jgi:hypothetical protein
MIEQFTNFDQGWRGPLPVVDPTDSSETFSGPWFSEWWPTMPQQPDPTQMSCEDRVQQDFDDIAVDTDDQALPQITCVLGARWNFQKIDR